MMADKHLADLIVQFTRDSAPLILLGRQKFGRQTLQLRLRAENLLEAALAFPLQRKNAPQRRSGKGQPDAEREGEQQDQARAEVRKEIAHLQTARLELALGKRMHPVGEIDGEASAGQDLVLHQSSPRERGAPPLSTRLPGLRCRDSRVFLS